MTTEANAQIVPASETETLVKKYPKVVAILDTFKREFDTVVEAYRTMIKGLRSEGIMGRELTVLLKHAGYDQPKQSKIKQIVEAPDAVYSAYMGGLGMNATLAAIKSNKSGSDGISSLPKVVLDGLSTFTEDMLRLHPAPLFRTGRGSVEIGGYVVTLQIKKQASKKVVAAKKAQKKKKAKKPMQAPLPLTSTDAHKVAAQAVKGA